MPKYFEIISKTPEFTMMQFFVQFWGNRIIFNFLDCKRKTYFHYV